MEAIFVSFQASSMIESILAKEETKNLSALSHVFSTEQSSRYKGITRSLSHKEMMLTNTSSIHPQLCCSPSFTFVQLVSRIFYLTFNIDRSFIGYTFVTGSLYMISSIGVRKKSQVRVLVSKTSIQFVELISLQTQAEWNARATFILGASSVAEAGFSFTRVN